MVSYKANVIFKGVDKVSPMLKGMGAHMTASTQQAIKSANVVKGVYNKVASSGRLMGVILASKAVSRGFAYAEMGVDAFAQSFVGLDQAITSASAKFGNIERGSQMFKKLYSEAATIGKKTEFTAKEAGDALEFYAMAGFSAEQSIKMLKPTADAASAGNMELARTADILSDAVGSFNLDMSAEHVEQSTLRIADVFAKAANSANITYETMFETMKMSAPSAAALGSDVETWAAIVAKLGSSGVKGTIAATALKNMQVRLASPTDKAAKMLHNLKLETKDATGNMRDLTDIMMDLDKALDGKGNVEKAKVYKELFGLRGIVGASAANASASKIAGAGWADIKKMRDAFRDSEGYSKKVAEHMRKGAMSMLLLSKSAAIGKGFEVMGHILGGKDITEQIKNFTKWINEIDAKEVAANLKTLGNIISWTFSIIKNNYKWMLAAYGAVKLAKAAKLVWGIASALKGVALAQEAIVVSEVGASVLAGKLGAASVTPAATTAAKAATVASVASMVVAVLGSAVIGAAIGTLLYKYVLNRNETDNKRRLEKLGTLGTKDALNAKNMTTEQLMAKGKEAKRLYGDLEKYKDWSVSNDDMENARINASSFISEAQRVLENREFNTRRKGDRIQESIAGKVTLNMPKMLTTVNINNAPPGITADVSTQEIPAIPWERLTVYGN